MSELKICKFYGRNSTNHQPMSKEQQLYECIRYAEENGYSIDQDILYYDDGISGTTADRPAWNALMNLVEQEKNLIILTYSTDRISRSLRDSVLIEEFLNNNDSLLISVSQPLLNERSSSAVLAKNIGYSVAQFHADNTRDLVLRKLYQNANGCQFNGGVPPYGYFIKDKQYMIDEHEAKAIRIIFEMIADGETYQSIAIHLTSIGFTKRSGKLFDNKSNFFDTIKNPIYKGTYVWGRTEKNKKTKKYNYHASRPIEEQIIIPNGVCAIVSEQLWKRANDTLNHRKKLRNYNTAIETYMLTSKIFCACGLPMYGNRRKSGNANNVFASYRCSCRDKLMKVKCNHAKELSKQNIDDYVLKTLFWFLKKENSLTIIQSIINDVLRYSNQDVENELTTAKKNLGILEKKINNLIGVLSEGGSEIKSLVDRLQILESEKKKLFEKVQSLEGKNMEIPILTTDEISKLLDDALQKLMFSEKEVAKVVVQQFVKKVIAENDKVQIEYDLNFIFCGQSHIKLILPILRTELNKPFHESYFRVLRVCDNSIIKIARSPAKRLLKEVPPNFISCL